MTLFKRLAGLEKKSFVQPDFWDVEAGFPLLSTALSGNEEVIGNDFEAYVQGAYKQSGVIFACITARQLAFSEARFAACRYQEDGRPGELKYTPGIELLQRPWPGGSIGDLLGRMELDVSLSGNFYATVVDDMGRTGRRAQGPTKRIVRLRPDWVTIVIGSKGDPNNAHPYDVGSKILGYEYNPPASGTQWGVISEQQQGLFLLPEDVCHYSPIPDPTMRYRGMSWVTPVINEITSDKAATKHKLKYFEMGASPKMAVALDKEITPEKFKWFAENFKNQHQGVDNAYKTLFLAGGANVTTVGADLKQLDFKATQGAGETRIAAASGVPPIIVGLSEGLESATYSNYGQARRRFADNTIRPLWRTAATALETLVSLKRTEHLRVDDRDIAFLREDLVDQSMILKNQAEQIRQLVDGGFDPDAVVRAVSGYDLQELDGQHTGLVSVQLLPPGMGTIDPATGELVPPDPAMVAGAQDTQAGSPNPSQQSVSVPKQPPMAAPAPSGAKRDWSTAERQRAARAGHALSDGSYPIENEEDLRNAIRLAGHGDAGTSTIRAHIRSRARALGLTHVLPEDWSGGED
ncbi:phage portal protein [Actinopolyspora halophila]|uniref:phage portal protein n=1 Tax=Actinopolyspora halophila TaxID=1850 RepID=UPI00035FEF5E|nr:phage portal protein [Actinopolyspora halophila]